MKQGTIYVDCPCCGARMEVERENGKVVEHWAKTQNASGDPIKDAMEKMKKDKEKRDKYFASAKDSLEDQKRKTLEKFEKEKERVQREGDNTPPPRPFDFD